MNSCLAFLALPLLASAAPTVTSTPEPVPEIRPATPEQLKTLTKFQNSLATAGQVVADVDRKTIVGMLGQEKKASGQLLLSRGRVRLDLKVRDSDERQLLLVGDKTFWAVTYPPSDLKDAAVQVVTGPVKTKKSGGQGFLALLGKDGFLKSFTVSGVALDKDGVMRYYLQPKADWVEAKRALLALTPPSELREIKIWDFQDNETSFVLENVKLKKYAAEKKTFDFTPPKNADVMPVH